MKQVLVPCSHSNLLVELLINFELTANKQLQKSFKKKKFPFENNKNQKCLAVLASLLPSN